MAIFNNSIDYFGQDLHILRNGEAFPLGSFFDAGLNLTFDYILPNDNYENITINRSNRTITAFSYINNPNEPKITNFYVTVTDGGTFHIAVLIHIHDSLDKVWLSPNTISFRKGMSLKFGIIADFTDGNYADLSFYPDMEKDLSSDGKKYFQIPFPPPQTPAKYDPNRISWKADPPEDDNPVSNAMIINLPPWMENVGSSTTQVTGNIHFQKDFGNVRFHRGNIDDIDNRLNILFLSDGFDGSNDANMPTFHKLINQFSRKLLKRKMFAPWNLLNEDVNIWSYYTEDIEKFSSSDSPHIVIKAE